MPGSSFGTARRSMAAPRPAPCASSGRAFERPPAPTSWSERIGFASPSAQHRSSTSWARRSISALPRCTESKSRSATFAPASIDEAAPPPMPISMPGPEIPDAARDHDRLVIAAEDARDRHLEGAEGPGEVRPAELVVERRGADRALEHDLERGGDPVGPPEVAL